MELTIVDRIVLCLFDQVRNVPMAIREAGYSQDQISAASARGSCIGVYGVDRTRAGPSDCGWADART